MNDLKPTMEEFLYKQLTDDDLKDLLAGGVEEANEDESKALPAHMEASKSASSSHQKGYRVHLARREPRRDGERNQYGSLVCEWEGCDYLTPKSEQFLSHLHFHGYHGQLKAHARSVHRLIDIPVCNRDTDNRNMISEQPTTFECEWDGCDSRFIRILDFFQHVMNHANEEHMKNCAENSAWCRWKNCDFKLDRKCFRYRNHVARHTNQKDIACDVCGAMFINPRKYLLHVCRRLDLSFRRHQCLQCGRYYSTKRLLGIHCYEVHGPATHLCSHCPAKFRRPGQLTEHIRRNHTKDLPFVCDKCEYRAATMGDLTVHAQRHKDVIRCPEVGCNLAFSTKNSLRTHLLQHYDLRPKVFECHLCRQQYRFGALLSKHMFFAHKGKRLTNAIPLRFKLDADGIFRLRSYVDSKQDRSS
ncbi:histone H4 transcription factor-like [Anopheles albimanus]|uniref:histone H4 transcription factor-like n=1 Tax=Anopheles albimanus TaxID=7167 RepID=UPI00163F4FED|nr:histone H4 transcription factor-like [Anopheles albimanus]